MTRRRSTHDRPSPIGALLLRTPQTCEAGVAARHFARRTMLAISASSTHASVVASQAGSTRGVAQRRIRPPAAGTVRPTPHTNLATRRATTLVGTHGFPMAAMISSVSRTAPAISAATTQGSPAARRAGATARATSHARLAQGPTPTARALSCRD